jgi:hypothetical protein
VGFERVGCVIGGGGSVDGKWLAVLVIKVGEYGFIRKLGKVVFLKPFTVIKITIVLVGLASILKTIPWH